MKVLIADDEALAREGLALMLALEKDLEVVGACRDGAEAVEAIRTRRPDLIFLDISMPGKDGFQVLEEIPAGERPLVIFLTAHEAHAVDAFRIDALDYLLKPVSGERLRASLERAREALRRGTLAERGRRTAGLPKDTEAHRAAGAGQGQRLMIRSAGHVYFLSPKDIRWVEAEGDYVTLHTACKSHLLRETLANMERRLAGQGFQRIHRSSVVNLTQVRELLTDRKGDYRAVLGDGTELRVGRRYREILCERLSVLS